MIPLSGVAPAPLAAAMRQVAADGSVPITVSAFCRITDSLRRDARELKPVCLSIAANGGAAFLEAAGVRVRVPERLSELRPDLLHAESWAAPVRASQSFVDEEAADLFVRRFCLYGTPEESAAWPARR